MTKDTLDKEQKMNSKQVWWYAPGIFMGILIGFMMFNDIILAIAFGIPIGVLFTIAISGATEKSASNHKK